MYGIIATRPWRSPSRYMRLSAASSRLRVAGAAPSFRRRLLYRSTEDDLAVQGSGHALLEELDGVRALCVGRRLANRAAAADVFDVLVVAFIGILVPEEG